MCDNWYFVMMTDARQTWSKQRQRGQYHIASVPTQLTRCRIQWKIMVYRRLRGGEGEKDSRRRERVRKGGGKMGKVWFVYLIGLFMSWPEQRVSPPIYNIKARYVAVALFLRLAKLHRQTFHRVREIPYLRITPSIYLHARVTLSFLAFCPWPLIAHAYRTLF